jgi:predicted Zn-dependent protease
MVTMRAQQRNEMTRMLIMTALGAGVAAINPQAGIGLMTGAGGMSQQGMMSFSREEERAADEYAVRLMQEADVPIPALLSVFQKMQNSYRELRTNPHNISHPLTEERIRAIRLHMEETGDRREPPKCQRLVMIQAKLIGYLDTHARVMTLYPETVTDDAALYARAISRMRAGNFDLARTGTNTLIRRHPTNPYFRELLGDLEFRSGNFDASVRAYEEALARIETAPQMRLALARALTERGNEGDGERATTLARTALLAERTPMAFLVLAKADTPRHDYYMAEFHLMRRNTKEALDFARKAVRNLPKDSPEHIKAQDIIDTQRRR